MLGIKPRALHILSNNSINLFIVKKTSFQAIFQEFLQKPLVFQDRAFNEENPLLLSFSGYNIITSFPFLFPPSHPILPYTPSCSVSKSWPLKDTAADTLKWMGVVVGDGEMRSQTCTKSYKQVRSAEPEKWSSPTNIHPNSFHGRHFRSSRDLGNSSDSPGELAEPLLSVLREAWIFSVHVSIQAAMPGPLISLCGFLLRVRP